ncbi:MAG TPA: MBL fold metallo-hydrolase [Candidatus Dormibacteraeota bacterium]
MTDESRLTFLNLGNPTGLKFTVEYGGRRLLFDFGLEHAPGQAPFSLGLAPRAGRELEDLLAVGSAPRLEGLYDSWDGRTAVFISHLHLDHTALVRFLHPDVPLHYPAAMESLRAAVAAAGYLPWRSPRGVALEDRRPVAWGEIEVTPVAVDHDLPGATGYLVRTPDLRLAYTGDHRWHGLHPELTAAFAEAARGVDVLVQEGVALEPAVPAPADAPLRPPRLSEREVLAGYEALLASEPGLVVSNLYPMNRERVARLAAAAAVHGRRLVMEPQAAIIAGHPDVLEVAEVRADPRRFVVQLGYESLPLLIDLRPPPGSVYVHSNGPPLGVYDPTYRVMEAWVRQLSLRFLPIGSSGHSWPEDVVRMVEAVRPGVALPVHSRAPEALVVPGVRVLPPEANRSYTARDLLHE